MSKYKTLAIYAFVYFSMIGGIVFKFNYLDRQPKLIKGHCYGNIETRAPEAWEAPAKPTMLVMVLDIGKENYRLARLDYYCQKYRNADTADVCERTTAIDSGNRIYNIEVECPKQ